MIFGEINDLINDKELKKGGFFMENSKIYDVDLELLDLPRKNGKLLTEEDLKDEFLSENFHLEKGADELNGSNCWVISGAHTDSGKPHLACDPHLMKLVSPKWHFSFLKWKDNFVMGATIPGMIFYSYARSKNNAYGCTAMNADTQDVFIEQIRDGKYFFEGEWYELLEKTEEIWVRFESKPRKYVSRLTRNGFLLEPVQKQAAKLNSAFHPKFSFPFAFYSIRYSYQHPVSYS